MFLIKRRNIVFAILAFDALLLAKGKPQPGDSSSDGVQPVTEGEGLSGDEDDLLNLRNDMIKNGQERVEDDPEGRYDHIQHQSEPDRPDDSLDVSSEGEGEGMDDWQGEGEADWNFRDEERKNCELKGPIPNFSFGEDFINESFSFVEAAESCAMITECIGVVCPMERKLDDKTCGLRAVEGTLYQIEKFPSKGHEMHYKLCEGDRWNEEKGWVEPPEGVGLDGYVLQKKGDKHHTPDHPVAEGEPGPDMMEELNNFWAEQTFTCEVQPGESEKFHETFYAPQTLKGDNHLHCVYFSEYNEADYQKVAITIQDPSGTQIYHSGERVDGIFKIKITKPGKYDILIANNHYTQATWVTLMCGGRNMIEKHHVDHVGKSVDKLQKLVRGIQQQGMYLWERQNSGLHHISGVNLNTLALRTFEFLVMAFMSALQIVYVKSLCAHRRII